MRYEARRSGSQGSRKPVFSRPAICDPKVKSRDARDEGAELDAFIRNATVSHSHQTCPPRWGAMPCQSWTSVSGFMASNKLRTSDGSIMPLNVTGNTMTPCVVIGERAGEMLKAEHNV